MIFQINVHLWFLLNQLAIIQIHIIDMSTENEAALRQPLKLNESMKESIEPMPHRHPPAGDLTEQQQPMLSSHQIDQHGKSIKCYRKVQVASVICLVIALLMIFAAPPLLQSKIVDLAIDQVVLKPDNQGLWAHFPGDSGVDIIRNFTFLELLNQDKFLFEHEKPIFKEFSGYKIKEVEDFLDIQYLQNGNQVTFRDWMRFELRNDTRDLSDKRKILNMGSLGYWYTLKNSRPTLLLQQGLAILFTTLESSIKPTLMGQGVFSQYVKDYKTFSTSYCFPAGVSDQNCQFLWTDVNYGFGDQNRLTLWINATESSFSSSEEFIPNADVYYLKNYFVLTDFQIGFILKKIKSDIASLTEILLQNHYCQDLPSLQHCTGRYLGVRQMATSFVTFDTPPVSTVKPTDTICQNNLTCSSFFPEIGAFYKRVYKIQHPQEPQVTPFDWKTVLKWFDYNTSSTGGKWNTDRSCLLHIGNLDDIWEAGIKYDKYQQQIYLLPMIIYFKLIDVPQAKVFWEWIKYITNVFVLQNKKNEHLGLSTLFSRGMYQAFAPLEDNIQPFLLAKLLKNQLKFTACDKLFEDSMGITDASLSISICNQYVKTYGTEAFAREMVEVCERTGDTAWHKLKQAGPSLIQLQQFCQPQASPTSFGAMLHQKKAYLDIYYQCNTTPVQYCSDFELAALQWSKSGVTNNPIPEIAGQLHKSFTFNDWDSNVPAGEYSYFVSKFNATEQAKFPKFNITETFSILNFDNWFSSTVALKKISVLPAEDKILEYMRYISIFIALNGFQTVHTPYEYMFGYDDPFLTEIKYGYPPFGGDPSAPNNVAFNDPNITKDEANLRLVFQTGKDDYRKLGQYYTINGYRYLTNEYAHFNGNITVYEVKTPWMQDDYFYGTNAKIFAPNQPEANNISLYIPNLQRYGSGPFTDAWYYERYGMDLYIAFIGEQLYESTKTSDRNKRYYQSIEACFNETSVVGIPIFTTKNHFMNTTDGWLQKVEIWDESMQKRFIDVGRQDDTYVIIEPYTGVSFQSTINLQNNYYHQPDILFTYPQPVLLPVFTIYRSGILSQEKAMEIYNPLLTGLAAKIVIKYIGVSLLVIFIVILAFLTYKIQKMKKEIQQHERSNPSALGISLQQPSPKDQETQTKPANQVEIHEDS